MTATTTPPDFAAIKTRQQAAWASGDYAVIGTTLQLVGESLAEACDIGWDQRVLDVAAGNGNATLAAARRGALVTSTDYVAGLLDRGAERLAADRLAATMRVADAEALPFDDASFDVVVSTFGVMFTPDQARAAGEMIRVCRPGGRIGLANWTPDGFIGRLFKVIGRHVAPAPGVSPPSNWGEEARVRELLAIGTSKVSIERRSFNFRYRSPAHFVEVFRAWYGPVHKAFAALPAEGQAALESDILHLPADLNADKAGALTVPSDYLEVVATRA